MRSVTDIFIRHPVLAAVVNIAIVLVGLRSMVMLPIQQYPSIESTSVVITTYYVGASAELIRGFLTTPIEQAVSSIAGVDYIESSSLAGASTITIRLKLNHDSTQALAEVNARLQQVRRSLPEEAEPPVVELQRADRPYASFYISFTSDQLNISELTDWLNRNIQPQLATTAGVQRVGVEAGQAPAMRIWISPNRLSELNLTPGDVYNSLRRNNYLAAIGRVRSDRVQIDLLANTDLRSVEEFQDLIVSQADGSIIRMRDVAEIELGSEEPMATAMYEGKEAVYLSVWPLPGSNEIEVANELNVALDRIRPSLPSHIDMQLAFDATKFMRDALVEISRTLAETILIVGCVIFLFMGSLRTAIVPLVAMPVSLIGATILMLLLGFSLNLLTILAIVLAVGLVVDDAIVVVENIQRHVQEGMERRAAALLGARELVGPIIAMTITLAVVYAPIGFQGGLTGMLFREFAFTLAAAVIVSGVVAITLSPVMSAYMVHPSGKESWLTRWINRRFETVRSAYAVSLAGALQIRWAIALCTLLVALCAAPLYMFSNKELAPVEDQSAIAVFMSAAPNATLKSTTKWAKELAHKLQALPESKYMWALVTPGTGFGGIITKDFHERSRSTTEMYPEVFGIVSQIPGVEPFPILLPPLPGAGQYDVELVIKSDQQVEQLAKLAKEIARRGQQAGLFMFVDTDLKLDLPQARVSVDREKIADLGMDLAVVAQELGVLLGGGYVNRFNYFNRSYQVIPQLAESERESLSSLMDLKIRAPSGDLISVSNFASIEPVTAPRTLTRFQQQSSLRIFAGVVPGITKETGLNTLEEIARDVLGESIGIDYAGESRQIRQEGSALVVTLGFALIMIYLVLAAQFKSFRDPLIVLLGSVPLAIVGALVLTFLGLTTINIYSQVGLITLVGLVAKNGILIVEFANSLQEQGAQKRDAIYQAAQTRLRPVLMTSFATVLGHYPLVLVTGPGAEARNSIGIVLVAGMAIGTVFTLFVVPALYLLLAAQHSHSTDEIDAEALAVEGTGMGVVTA
ncbi:efflux RND transporter permease subunit [Aureliella helgolandensis]|uniref:Efflux pump membrane transporter BepE n=1 Tax=Aureliella helgolandensis TaxID=2527968 RepID=A0A518GFU6_9BACT|nr:efflux RND transporter permease subunit [Aureliella helgolandensis]QDV27463.1 Efflux pump membrane transporter BepE [Aureliella helgolandensis]